MKLEEINKKIKTLEIKKEKFLKKINKELSDLEKEKIKIVPKTLDFSEHEGKTICAYKAVNSKGNLVYLPDDDICCIENGKPYFSSYYGGIVQWNNNSNSYIHMRYGNCKELDIIGFYDVVFEEDDD